MSINVLSKSVKVVLIDDLTKWARDFLSIENLYLNHENGFSKRNDNEFIAIVDNDYRLSKKELKDNLEMHYNDYWASCTAVIACALAENAIEEHDQYMVIKADEGDPLES